MASKFHQGIFVPKNADKYVGNKNPRYRSSWELVFMQFCDSHPSVQQWASEAVQIPYQNPITGKHTIYVPDFFITYIDKSGQTFAEMVEIKPRGQSLIESKRASANNRAIVAVNHAKWHAAAKWCKRAGIQFRVINEGDIFAASQGRK